MATEVHIPDSVCLKKGERGDNALASEILEEKVKQLESGPNKHLEISSHVADTVNTQLESGIATNEGGIFFQALSVPKIAADEQSNKPEICGPAREDQEERKTTKVEAVTEEKPNDDESVFANEKQPNTEDRKAVEEISAQTEGSIDHALGLIKGSDKDIEEVTEIFNKTEAGNEDDLQDKEPEFVRIKESIKEDSEEIRPSVETEDLNESSREIFKEEREEKSIDAHEEIEQWENGAKDKEEQKPDEIVNKIVQPSEIEQEEEIKPSVKIEEKTEQNESLHAITTDPCISTETKSQVETTEHQEENQEEATESDDGQKEKSDSSSMKEVCEETESEKVESEKEAKISYSSMELNEKSAEILEDEEPAFVEIKENVKEDREEMEEKTVTTNAEPEEETIENEEKNDEKAIGSDAVESKKSGRSLVKEVCEETESKKAESEEGLIFSDSVAPSKKEVASKDEDQGDGDDIKETTTGQHAAQDLNESSREIYEEKTENDSNDAHEEGEEWKNGAKDKEEQKPDEIVNRIVEFSEIKQEEETEEIKPSAKIEENHEDDLQDKTVACERQPNTEEIMEICDKDERSGGSSNTKTEALKEDGLQDKEPEFVKIKESPKEDTEEIRPSVETGEKTDYHRSTQTEPEEETIENEEKNVKTGIESDNGELKKSGRTLVKESCEEIDSEKAESEEGLKVSDNVAPSEQGITRKEEEQEIGQAPDTFEKDQGDGDDIKETQDLNESSREIFEEEIEDETIDAHEETDKQENGANDKGEQKPDESVNKTVHEQEEQKPDESVKIEEKTEQNEFLHAITTQTKSQVETTEHQDENQEETTESDDGQKEKFDSSSMKEVCEEINSEKVEPEKEVKLSESSSMELNEKATEIIEKDEDQEKEHGEDDEQSNKPGSCEAATTEDQEERKTTKFEEVTEGKPNDDEQHPNTENRKAVEEISAQTEGSIDQALGLPKVSDKNIEDVTEIYKKDETVSGSSNTETEAVNEETTENEENNDEKDIKSDDGESKKPGTPFVKEACEETGLKMAESEEGLKFSDSMAPSKQEIASKDEEQVPDTLEKDQGDGNDVTSSQDVTCDEIKETTTGQHATQDLNESSRAIFKQETADELIDAHEECEQWENGANGKGEQKPDESVNRIVQFSEIEQEEETEKITPSVKIEEKPTDILTKEDQEKGQSGGDDVTGSQNESIEHIIETTGQNANTVACFEEEQDLNTTPKEILKEDAKDTTIEPQEASEKGENGTKEKMEQKTEESVNESVQFGSEIKQEEDTEEIKPSVETEEKTTDVCITAREESEVESAEHEEKTEDAINTGTETVESEGVKPFDNSSMEQNEKSVSILSKCEDQEKEDKLNELQKDQSEDDASISTQTESQEGIIQHEDKNEEEVIESDNGQKESSGSFSVKEVCKEISSEKVEYEEDEIARKVDDQEKEQEFDASAEGHGGGDDVTSSQDVTCEDTKEVEGLSSMPKEILIDAQEERDRFENEENDNREQALEESVNKTVHSKLEQEECTEEIKPSAETDEKEQHDSISGQTESQEMTTGHEEEVIETDDARKENSDHLSIKEVCEETCPENVEYEGVEVSDNYNPIISKDEDREKEQELNVSEQDQGNDDITFSQGLIHDITADVCIPPQTESQEETMENEESIEKAKSEGVQLSDNFNVALSEDETVSKVDDQEKDVVAGEGQGGRDDSTISQDATREDAKEVQGLSSMPKEIFKKEEVDKSIDAQEVSKQYENEENDTSSKLEQEEFIETVDARKESSDNLSIKKVCEEINLEKVESEGVELSDSSDIKLNEKAIAIISKDEYREKEQEIIMSEQDQGENNATSIEDLEAKNHIGEGNEPEVVKTRDCIEEDPDVCIPAQTEYQEEALENEENNKESIESGDGQKEKLVIPSVKEVCDEISSENVESEEGAKPFESYGVKLNEKATSTFKDEDQDMSEEVKGSEDDVISSQNASSEDIKETMIGQPVTTVTFFESMPKEILNEEEAEDKSIDFQEASEQSENGAKDKIELKPAESDSKPVHYSSKIGESNIKEDEADAGNMGEVSLELGQPKKEHVEEIQACLNKTISEKTEVEISKEDDDLSHDSIEDRNDNTIEDEKNLLDERTREIEISTLEQEPVEDTTDLKPQKDTTPSGSLGTSTEETTISEKAKEESEDLLVEELEPVSEVQIPGVVLKSEDSNLKEDCLISSIATEDSSEIEKDAILTEKVPLEIQEEKGRNDFKEHVFVEDSYSTELQKTAQNQKEMAHEIPYSEPITVRTPEVTEASIYAEDDLQAAEDIKEVTEKSVGIGGEVENDSVYEAPKEERVPALEDSATLEPRVNLSNKESADHPSESEKTPTQAFESVSDVQTPEVVADSEDSEIKEDRTISERCAPDAEEENGKQALTENDLHTEEKPSTKENIEPHRELEATSELAIEELEATSEPAIEEDQVNETKSQRDQSDITSENIMKNQILESKLEHTTEKDLVDGKQDVEEDVTLTPENQINSSEYQNETVKNVVLTDEIQQVAVETEKEKGRNEVKGQDSDEASNDKSIPVLEDSKALELQVPEVESIHAPSNGQETTEEKSVLVSQLERENIEGDTENRKEAPNLLFDNRETDDKLISEIQTPEAILKMEIKEEHLEATNDTCETLIGGLSSEKLLDELKKSDAKEDIENFHQDAVAEVTVHERLSQTEEKSYSEPILVQTPEVREAKVDAEIGEDLQAAEDIKEGTEKSVGIGGEVENESADEAPKEERVPALEDSATLEESTDHPSESEKSPTQAFESVSDVQTPEVVANSEDSEIKEDRTISERCAPDTEEENVEQAPTESDETKRSDLNIEEKPLTKENIESYKELEPTSEPAKEENQVKETKSQPDQSDITSENIMKNQILESKLEHTIEKDLVDGKWDVEEDVINAPENQISSSEYQNLTNVVTVETEEEKGRNEIKGQDSEVDSIDEASRDKSIPVLEDSKALEFQVNLPEVESTNVTSNCEETIEEKCVLVPQLTEREITEGATENRKETSNLEPEKKEPYDKHISEIQTPEAILKMEIKEATEETCEKLMGGLSSEKLLDELKESDAKKDTEVIVTREESATDDYAVAEVTVDDRLSQTEEKLVSMVPPEELASPMAEDQTNELVLETNKTQVEHSSTSNKDLNQEFMEEDITKTFSENQSIKERYIEEEDVIVNEVFLEAEKAKESTSIKDEADFINNQSTSATDEVCQIKRLNLSPNELIETKDSFEDTEDQKLMTENLNLKAEAFTAMQGPNEDMKQHVEKTSEIGDTEEKIIEADANKEKETLKEPHADDPEKTASDTISSSKEQDEVRSGESRGHGDMHKLEEKTNEVSEIVSADREVSAILTENLPEASYETLLVKDDREMTPTIEKIEEEIKDKDETFVNVYFSTSTKEAPCLSNEDTEELQVDTLNSEKEREAVQPQEDISDIKFVDLPSEYNTLPLQNDKKDQDSFVLLLAEKETIQSADKRFEEAPVIDVHEKSLDDVSKTECSEIEQHLDTKELNEQKKEVEENVESEIPIEETKSSDVKLQGDMDVAVRSADIEVPSAMDAAADERVLKEDDKTPEAYQAEKGVLKEDLQAESACDRSKTTEVSGMKQEPLEFDAPVTPVTAATENLKISQKSVTDDLIKITQIQPEVQNYEDSAYTVDKQSPNNESMESNLLTGKIDESHEQKEPTTNSLNAEAEDLKATQVSGTEPLFSSSEVFKADKKISDEKEKSETAEPTKGNSEVAEKLIEEREKAPVKDHQAGKEETGDNGAKTDIENEEGEVEDDEDNQKMGSCSEAPVMVEASKDIEVKAHKKSHNILSGVGSKVKHSIAKVKKAITGKSSHPKPPSPKEKDQVIM